MTDLFHFISFCVDHINTANHHFSLHNKINSGFNYKVTGLDQIGKIHMIPLHLTLASLSSLTLNVLLIPVAFSCCPLCLTAKRGSSWGHLAVFHLGGCGCCVCAGCLGLLWFRQEMAEPGVRLGLLLPALLATLPTALGEPWKGCRPWQGCHRQFGCFASLR